MTNLEIKQKIDENNSIIEQLVTPNKFTLNNTVAKLLEENKKLQTQCQQNFVNGYSAYCYAEEKE